MMEMVSQTRPRPSYYFSLMDQEILDDHVLALSCDEDTWLYKIDTANVNGQQGHFQLGLPYQHQQIPSTSGSVDSRTYTRRKHCSLQPSLQSVVESSPSNRSSLGLLSASTLLNNTLKEHFTPIQNLENPERIFSNSIASDKKVPPQRVFKLDSPFMNSDALGRVSQYTFQRSHLDSESSDISIPHSLENFNEAMTDSLVNFLEKQEVNCRPPTAFQDECQMTDSLISLPETLETQSGKKEQMTDSMVNFLVPVDCKPPSGFEDNDLTGSMVNINETEGLPTSNLTRSVMDYLENVGYHHQGDSLIASTTSSETENIPPQNIDGEGHPGVVFSSRLSTSGDELIEEIANMNSTYALERSGDPVLNLSNKGDEIDNITFTNCVNITRRRQDNGDIEDDLNATKTVNTTFEKELNTLKDHTEKSVKTRALNNRDLNVTCDLKNEEIQDLNSTKIITKEIVPSKFHSSISATITKKNGSIRKSELNDIPNRQIPLRNSTFNTTFTKLNSRDMSRNSICTESKLQLQSNNSTFIKIQSQSLRGLNTTFTKSIEGLNGGMEDDQTSSASDSSFSSGSTKPRSVDELRSIAQQQETSLAQQTSTPTDSSKITSNLSKLDLELSPIRRTSAIVTRNNESRSANSSPVRSPHPRLAHPHPVSQLQAPSIELRRQNLQASSLSNIARPKMSGLRMPQQIGQLTGSQRFAARPATAPVPAATAIPRPHMSRLPVSRFRSTGIPSLKRGSLH